MVIMSITVPILDLRSEYNYIKDEVDEAIQRVLQSGTFILGPELDALEKEIAAYCQTEFAVGVASGTDALLLALIACGIGKGDEVITTPFTFIATAEVISHVGAQPVFVDIDKRNFNINTKLITAKITKRTKAIIPVHLFGQASDMGAILDIAKDRGIKVIEDCAQAIGAEYKGEKVGSLGDAGCFSFYPTKNLGAYGDAGMVVTCDEHICKKIRMLRTHGSSDGCHYKFFGFNSRLDEIQAAVLRIKLKYLDEWNDLRRERAGLYNLTLSKITDIALPVEEDYNRHVYNQYAVRIKKRDKIKDQLAGMGISTGIYYSIPIHQQQVYAYLDYKENELTCSEQASKEILSLPIFPFLTAGQLRRVSESLISLISKNK